MNVRCKCFLSLVGETKRAPEESGSTFVVIARVDVDRRDAHHVRTLLNQMAIRFVTKWVGCGNAGPVHAGAISSPPGGREHRVTISLAPLMDASGCVAPAVH
jgi:hypothetical protein